MCDSAAAFQAERSRGRADLYLLDLRLPDGNGIDLLRSLRQGDDATPVVMISGHGTIRDAVDATRTGAFDFLEKPLARDRVLLVTKNAVERADLQRENQRFRELVGDAPKMIGRSEAFRRPSSRPRRWRDPTSACCSSANPERARNCWRRTCIGRAHSRPGRSSRSTARRFPTELIESELFGHEKGRVHRRGVAAARPLRAGRRRHDLSRRGRRPARSVAGQAACASCRTANCSASAASSPSASASA